MFFNELIKSLSLPIGWSTYIDGQILILYKPVYKINQLVIEKQIVISDDVSVNFYVYNVLIEPGSLGLIPLTYPINTKNLSEVIGSFNYKQVCQGGPMAINFPGISITTAKNNNGIWRHKECSLLLNKKKRCLKCDYLFPIFKKYKKRSMLINSKRIGPTLTPTRRRFLNNTLNNKKNIKKSNSRLRITIGKLNSLLADVQNKTATLTDSALNTLFTSNNLSNSQKTIITEIITSSKAVKPNNRRYSEDWILLCILLKIRSSSTYLFLKEQEILPLPCTRTIRMYLSLINTQCGFYEKFFLLFKKKVAMLKKEEKHGVLVFDEIFLRESLQVNSQTLTYSGLENFGGEIESSGLKANHGLVFLFQSLGANFTQPIAVFASNGPVKGLVLAQLVIKAICLLEKSGVIVNGVVSDGATTNRKLWSELGVTGEKGNIKNTFKHPLNNKRNIYMISDAPHLIKNIRNRLFNKKGLRESADSNYIRWSHYEEVHKNDLERDSIAPSRVCPKITHRHLAPDSFNF